MRKGANNLKQCGWKPVQEGAEAAKKGTPDHLTIYLLFIIIIIIFFYVSGSGGGCCCCYCYEYPDLVDDLRYFRSNGSGTPLHGSHTAKCERFFFFDPDFLLHHSSGLLFTFVNRLLITNNKHSLSILMFYFSGALYCCFLSGLYDIILLFFTRRFHRGFNSSSFGRALPGAGVTPQIAPYKSYYLIKFYNERIYFFTSSTM